MKGGVQSFRLGLKDMKAISSENHCYWVFLGYLVVSCHSIFHPPAFYWPAWGVWDSTW